MCMECCPTLEKREFANVLIRIWAFPTIVNWFWLWCPDYFIMVSELQVHPRVKPSGHTCSTSPNICCPRVWLENSPHVRGRVRMCMECCPTLEKRDFASEFIRIWVSPTKTSTHAGPTNLTWQRSTFYQSQLHVLLEPRSRSFEAFNRGICNGLYWLWPGAHTGFQTAH